MKYNYNELARTYVKGFYKFLIQCTNIWDKEEAYILFRYSMHKLYDLEVNEISGSVLIYGDTCVEYLKNLKRTPKDISKISWEDRVHLFNYCETYLVTINILFWNSREVVKNEN